MSKNIVVVGSLNLDLVANVPRMPLEGETITGLGFAMHPGGKGANQAVAAARLGGDVAMVGRVGYDVFASTLRAGLSSAGVNAESVKNVAGPSGSAVILVTAEGHNSIVVTPGANASLMPNELNVEMATLSDAAIILAQLEIPIETVERLGSISRELNVPFVLDPAPARELPRALLETVTWLTPNESETRTILKFMGHEIAGEFDDDAASLLLETGVRNVVLKLGGRGVYLAGKDVESCFIPAFKVTAKDTTAAGDAFNGGFAYALTSGMAPKEAARFACAVAAISVTRSGAQPSMPALTEVESFLSERSQGAGTSGREA